jgi:hypothetical protein
MSRRTFWDEPRPADTFKCAECGERVSSPEDIVPGVQCKKCGMDLHSCRNCTYFDTSAEKECRQPVSLRIPKKRADNDCSHFKPILCVDLTGPKKSGSEAAKKAFDDLFR